MLCNFVGRGFARCRGERRRNHVHRSGWPVDQQFDGAYHSDFGDAVWLARGGIKTGTMGPERAVAAVRDYVATFLDVNLQNRALESLLTGPSLDCPDASVTTQTQSLCGEKGEKGRE